MSFRFRNKKAHLTYRGHLPHVQFLRWFQELTPSNATKYYSFVHENGHADSETNYEHTHFYFSKEKSLDFRDPRCFDFNGVHPHIQLVKDSAHERKIYHDYHKKEPVFLEQSANGPDKAQFDIDAIRSAPTLAEACEGAGIVPRSVSDIKLLRDDPGISLYEHPFPDAIWTLNLPENIRALVLWGPTGTGKTQRALAYFERPLVVRHMDDLRAFQPSINDGIVFDDMSFGHMPRTSIIHLLDWEVPSSIHCRYSTAKIPAKTRKIFTSNERPEQMFGHDDPAIARRFTSIHVVGPTYTQPPITLSAAEDFDLDLSIFDEEVD